jgi:hypothetical protein
LIQVSSPAKNEQSTSWILDPEVFVFSSGDAIPVGAAEQHGVGETMQHLFGKSREVVKDNWLQVVEQMRYLISHVDALTENYELSEVEFQLGFSAEGTIVFIAQGGINATISATFKRTDSSTAARK